MWQAYFCHDKRRVLSQQTDKSFVATKMILVAAPASDTAAGVVGACRVFALWLGGGGRFVLIFFFAVVGVIG